MDKYYIKDNTRKGMNIGVTGCDDDDNDDDDDDDDDDGEDKEYYQYVFFLVDTKINK